MEVTLEEIFSHAYDLDVAPFPFQHAFAKNPNVDILIAPTGLGKTAAVTLGWVWRRINTPSTTPRRLVWCLPMRTLVEQTAREAERWMQKLGDVFSDSSPKPSVHLLMGGAVDEDWRLSPEDPAIIVGTQDMLLSRALMRGYGMSRFGWPVDYGLLHTDALWVYDEVQLMGAGLATSAQLEAFRRRPGWQCDGLARSLWVSATLDPEWLKTAEFRQHVPNPVVLRWDDGKPPEPPRLSARLDAVKRLSRADTILTAISVKKPEAYASSLVKEIASLHRGNATSLVIVNTVRRARLIYKALNKVFGSSTKQLLIHSRYRPIERRVIEKELSDTVGEDRVVVATQAVEAGVDMTSAVLFTELAPWSSLVQRFGRCNRSGELNAVGGAEIRWIDIESDSGEEAVRPYGEEDPPAARSILQALENASPRSLPPPSRPTPPRQVIRPKDFDELFDTDADLSGYDLDVSPYIRDSSDVSVSLFWRPVGNSERVAAEGPARDELCAAPLSAELRAWLTPKDEVAPVYIEDPLGGAQANWVRLRASTRRLRSGATLLLDVGMGGYDSALGFVGPEAKAPVIQVTELNTNLARVSNDAEAGDLYEDDRLSFNFVEGISLERHLDDVAREVRMIGHSVGLTPLQLNAVARAGAWHDLGKAYAPFQTLLGRAAQGPLLAKSTETRAPQSRREQAHEQGLRKYFRHELASALAFLQQRHSDPDANLIAFLIVAHHGRVRMGLRALPQERSDQSSLRLARGVQDGDQLPEVRCGEEVSNAVTLDLTPMELGEDQFGHPSWSARMQALLAEYGPFRLAYLEAILRVADWRASASYKGNQS